LACRILRIKGNGTAQYLLGIQRDLLILVNEANSERSLVIYDIEKREAMDSALYAESFKIRSSSMIFWTKNQSGKRERLS
jgi:hypothetical protein